MIPKLQMINYSNSSIILTLFLVNGGNVEGEQMSCPFFTESEVRRENQSLPFRGKAILEPSVEPYVALQLKLEKIAEESKIHYLPKSERQQKLIDLESQSTVRKIRAECQSFHVTQQCTSDLRYRSIDGTCNNLKNPKWGSTYSPNLRIVPPPAYEGGFNQRKSVTGEELPNGRSITVGALKDEDHPSEKVSLLFPLLGQLLDHDMTNTPLISFHGSKSECCKATHVNKQLCAPLLISPCDPFYHSINKTCVEFLRSAPYPTCDLNKRNQMNAVTSFIDASVVYGTSEEQAKSLRTLDGTGKLKYQTSRRGGELLKGLSNGANDDVCPPNATRYCFVAGDSRVNEHSFLTSLQTLMQREHNRIADHLHELNPQWKDEVLYQETRKIVGAEFQNIVCKDYFPSLLGSYHKVCEDSYDEKTNPGILTEFSTAAYRLHSMIAHKFNKSNLSFETMFSNPETLHDGRLDSLMTGASGVAAQKNDPAMITDISNFLYKYPYESFGIDLPTINIQRGRDHGLAVYAQLAEICSGGKHKFKDFSDLQTRIPQDRIDSLRKYYKDVRDIDLWVGLVSEKTFPDSVLGPTSICIIASQFRRVIKGDRFFYKHKGQPNSFTEEQLEVIEKSSMAKIICENTEVSEIARNPLLIPSEENPMESCETFKQVGFKPWKVNKE